MVATKSYSVRNEQEHVIASGSFEGVEKSKEIILDSISRLEERIKQLHVELEKLNLQLAPLMISAIVNDLSDNVIFDESIIKAKIDQCNQSVIHEIALIQSIRHNLDL